MSHSRPLCLYFRLDSKLMFHIGKSLPMTGFEAQTSGVESNCSTNWATTTARLFNNVNVLCTITCLRELKSNSNFRVGKVAEIKLCDWMLQIMWLILTNQSAALLYLYRSYSSWSFHTSNLHSGTSVPWQVTGFWNVYLGMDIGYGT